MNPTSLDNLTNRPAAPAHVAAYSPLHRPLYRRAMLALGLLTALASASCETEKPKPPPPPRYETLPPKDVPEFLRGTVLERVDHINPEPLQVSNYGLVVGLPATGDSTAPTPVREYIIKEMLRRGFNSNRFPEYRALTPETVLDDPGKRTAIVRVDGFMPPGVRAGQTFDVVVTALGESNVTSLAGGTLYRTDLKFGGADTREPAKVIEVQGKAQGSIFLNPDLALNPQAAVSDRNASRLARRQGVILDGGICDRDQPLILRMRAPQRSVVYQISQRIKQQFQDPGVAQPQDEAIIRLYLPPQFNGDWERFVGVCMNLYLSSTPELLFQRAKRLAEEAMKPDAPLQNISFAWEGMGPVCLPIITPLMDARHPQDVQFAAARAAAFIGDGSAQQALLRIATDSSHRFQIDAVRTLGALKPTPGVQAILRKLLESDAATVRIEAYKVLAAARSPVVFSLVLPKAGVDERFILDVVQSSKPTVIYATRSGTPRLAIIGRPAAVATPVTFTALDDRLSISSRPGEPGLTLFYRESGAVKPIRVKARTDLAELIGWLGGAAPDPDDQIDLSYGEIVAIVKALADQNRLVAPAPPGAPLTAGPGGGVAGGAAFVLQDIPLVTDQLSTAPPILPPGRTQSEQIPGLPTTRFVGPEPGEKSSKDSKKSVGSASQ